MTRLNGWRVLGLVLCLLSAAVVAGLLLLVAAR
jgi:hypothetical protein